MGTCGEYVFLQISIDGFGAFADAAAMSRASVNDVACEGCARWSKRSARKRAVGQRRRSGEVCDRRLANEDTVDIATRIKLE